MQPILLVTDWIAKSDDELPVSLNILFSQKIKRESRKTFIPVIVSSTRMLPAGSPTSAAKLSSSKPTLKTNSSGVVLLPA